MRPKRVANSGERPTSALKRGGIEYIEIRSLDVNVYDPVGINQDTMRFIESFMIFCLLRRLEILSTLWKRSLIYQKIFSKEDCLYLHEFPNP